MKRIILIGQGGSGKDFLKAKLQEKGLTCSVSCTTRSARPGEVEGESYFFINEETFKDMIAKDEFREWNKFAEKWYYGTTRKHFEEANLFIMTPSGIRALSEEERKESFVIYINISEDVRRERLSKRKDADNAERRLETDRIDFADYKDYNLHITDPAFNAEEIFSILDKTVLLKRNQNDLV